MHAGTKCLGVFELRAMYRRLLAINFPRVGVPFYFFANGLVRVGPHLAGDLVGFVPCFGDLR